MRDINTLYVYVCMYVYRCLCMTFRTENNRSWEVTEFGMRDDPKVPWCGGELEPCKACIV